MSGLLNELDSYKEVQKAIAKGVLDRGYPVEEMRERKRAKLNELIKAKKEELAPYDRAGITSRYTDKKASKLRKELQALRVKLGKACKVPPLKLKRLKPFSAK